MLVRKRVYKYCIDDRDKEIICYKPINVFEFVYAISIRTRYPGDITDLVPR